jgi:hypothetical protein
VDQTIITEDANDCNEGNDDSYDLSNLAKDRDTLAMPAILSPHIFTDIVAAITLLFDTCTLHTISGDEVDTNIDSNITLV